MSDDYVSTLQILNGRAELPTRTAPPPAPLRRSFKDDAVFSDLLDDLTFAQDPVRQDLLAVFRLADRAPDAATDREFMAGVKAIWTGDERAAFRRVGAASSEIRGRLCPQTRPWTHCPLAA